MGWQPSLPANATKIRLSPAIFQANWNALETGTVPYDALRLQAQAAAPARVAGHGFVYGKDPGTGITELHYEDDQNPSVNTQLTTSTATAGIGALGQLIYGSAVITSGTYQNTQNAFCSAWGNVDSAGSLTAGFGVTATRISTGLYRIAFNVALSSAAYSICATPVDTSSPNHNRTAMVVVQAAGNFRVRLQRIDQSGGSFEDCGFTFAVFGGR